MSATPTPLELTLELSRAESAADPYAFRLAPQEYRRRAEDGTYQSATFLWDSRMEQDLAALEAPSPDRARVQRLGESLRSFLVALGWERDELRLRQAMEAGRRVHLTCRFAAAELYALPWELVTVHPTRQHLGELPGAVVQYEWPGTQTAPPLEVPPPEGGRLLFACAADVPADLHLLALRRACARTKYPFDAARDFLAHVSLARLGQVLDESSEPIAALHVLCHGARLPSGAYGLVWHPSGPLGQVELLDAAALRQVLGAHARRIRMVVLCACSGADPGPPGNQLGSAAQALHQLGIPAVVAFRFPVSKPGSVRLTEALYGALLSGTSSLQEALGTTRAALARESGSLDWASLQLYARAEDGPAHRPFVLRPYRGLLPFEPHHRSFFFGREALRRALLDRIEQAARGTASRFQVVAGASGSGKSSLVMAGALPALDPAAWEVRILRPGNAPALEEARRWHEPGRHLLLFVDQLEEAFTQLRDPAERQGFFRALWQLAGGPGPSVVVVATLRVDHFERCGEIWLEDGGRRLDTVVYSEAHRVFVPQLDLQEQEVVIQGPAQAVGLELEDGLSERLRRDVGQEPGALPLLEYALDLLWQQREGGRLTHRAYEGMGGVAGALTRSVEGLYGSFSPRQRFQLRRLVIELVELGGLASPETRRRVFRDEVRPAGRKAQATFDSVVEALVERRLLVQGGGMEATGAPVWIEIAHEALIRQWRRLQRWIQEDRERSTQLRELNGWAQAWHGHRSDPDGGASYLLTGDRLGYARRLQEQHRGYLSAESVRFIDASWKRSQEDRWRERRTRRRLVWLTAGLAVFLVLTTGLGALAFQLWKRSEVRAKEVLRAGWLSRTHQLLADGDPNVAAQLLLEVGEPGPQVDEWRALALQVLERPVPEAIFRHPKAVRRVAFSPDGKRLATACDDGTVRVWSADGRGPALELPGHGNTIASVTFSPDGTRVVSGSWDGTARVWSVDGKGAPVVLKGHGREVRMAAFSPDGTQVVTASEDGTARVWRADGKGEPTVLRGHHGGVHHAAFSPDGKLVATASADRTARIWNADGTGAPALLKGHQGEVGTVTFSPDGRLLLTTSIDQTARLWTVGGDEVAVLRGHENAVWLATFSPRGDRVLTASLDGTARVWSLDGKELAMVQHQRQVWSAAFSPDGSRIATGSADQTARVWSVDGRELMVLGGHQWEVQWVAFNPRGDRVVTAGGDHTVRVWRVDRVGGQIELHGHHGPLTAASFSADGERVLAISSDGTALVWPRDGQGEPWVVRPGSAITSAALSRDGSKVALASADGAGRVWSADRPAEPVTLGGPAGPISALDLAPDGARVVAASDDGTARLWRSGREAEPVALECGQGQCRYAAFSPDGRRVLLASTDGTARVVNVTGSGAALVLAGHAGPLLGAAFSADGARVVTVSEDGTARVWRTDQEGPPVVLGEHLSRHQMTSAAFSSDGARVVTASSDGIARVWRADGPDKPVVELRHGAPVLSATFSPDGQWVLTASGQRIARLWRLDRAQEPLELRGHQGPVVSAAFSPDGQWAVTASADGTARVWALSVAALQARLRGAGISCLSVWERQQYFLDSGEAAARKSYEQCERSYGRLP